MCKKNIASQWAQRLLFEASLYNGENSFITLTYDDANLPDELKKDHLIKFNKRLRKHIEPEKLKFFGCGEYGDSSGRPHFHIIYFNFLPKNLYIHHFDKGKPIYSSPEIDKIWTNGFNQVGSVEKGSIYYVTGYVLKKHGDKGFRLMSKGLGLQYALKNKEVLINRYLEGHSLPRYLCDALNIPNLVKSEIIQKNDAKLTEHNNMINKKYTKKNDLIKDKRNYRSQLEEARDLLKTGDLL